LSPKASYPAKHWGRRPLPSRQNLFPRIIPLTSQEERNGFSLAHRVSAYNSFPLRIPCLVVLLPPRPPEYLFDAFPKVAHNRPLRVIFFFYQITIPLLLTSPSSHPETLSAPSSHQLIRLALCETQDLFFSWITSNSLVPVLSSSLRIPRMPPFWHPQKGGLPFFASVRDQGRLNEEDLRHPHSTPEHQPPQHSPIFPFISPARQTIAAGSP